MDQNAVHAFNTCSKQEKKKARPTYFQPTTDCHSRIQSFTVLKPKPQSCGNSLLNTPQIKMNQEIEQQLPQMKKLLDSAKDDSNHMMSSSSIHTSPRKLYGKNDVLYRHRFSTTKSVSVTLQDDIPNAKKRDIEQTSRNRDMKIVENCNSKTFTNKGKAFEGQTSNSRERKKWFD